MTDDDGTAPVEAADVLDRMANPHPRMWAEARLAYAVRLDTPETLIYWEGYLAAMAAATGYDRAYFDDKLAEEQAANPVVVDRPAPRDSLRPVPMPRRRRPPACST